MGDDRGGTVAGRVTTALGGLRRRARRRPATVAIAVLAAAGAAVVFFVAHDLFPYHSVNHDEGVYLQQAAMFLEGKLLLEPPVPEAVRPWFFVADDGRLYPKYGPGTALVFAPGVALGVPRLVLAAVAGVSAACVGLLGRAAFDGRVGAVAAGLLLTAPLFVVNSATFLSYAPTTALNLVFALSYVRALRRRRLRYAALAGLAVGFAFLSRPYTALLFALPFVVHALVTLGGAWYRHRRVTDAESDSEGRHPPWGVTRRLGLVAAVGTAFVGLTLGYNWVLTGDPLVFPYQAFAPEDGVGFGHREILGHERDYTVEVALDANRRVLRQLVTRWGPLGWLGSALAAVGLVSSVAGQVGRRLLDHPSEPSNAGGRRAAGGPLSDPTLQALLAALFVTVSLGNLAFWGNLNVLGAVEDPTDGLVASLGPFYHFDLLLPLSVFAGAGVVTAGDRLRALSRRLDGPLDRAAVRNGALALVLVAALAGGASVGESAFEDPVDRNAEYRDTLATVYEPFERTDLENALVFVPTPLGPWLNHPFQRLRNDPSFDGGTVYVMDRGAGGDATSLAAFPDRTPYRFTYRDEWSPFETVTPTLERLSVRSGDRLDVSTTTGVVAGAQTASVRVAAGGETLHYGVQRVDGPAETVNWTLSPEGVTVDSRGLRRYSGASSLALDGPTTVTLSVTYVQAGGATISYVQELTVLGTETGAGVRVLWPPEARVCRLTTDCGRAGTYLPGGDYATGVSLSTNLTGTQDE
ncbi:MAG: glycosyltransferase family 39 protein [Haloarculaceae archaeon]